MNDIKNKTKDQLIKEIVAQQKYVEELERSETERKRIEEKLVFSEKEKVTILDCLEEHVIYEDKEMKIQWANRSACESAGLTRNELIGRYCYDVWPNRNDPCPDCPVVKTMKTGRPQEIEKATPDGRIWFIKGYPQKDEDGNITGAIEITLEITEHKKTEEELQNTEKKYRTVFENTGTAMVIIEEDTTISLVNNKFEELSGFPKKEIEGKKSWTELIVKEDVDRMKKQHDLRRKKPQTALKSYEFRLIDKKKKVKNIQLNVDMIPGTKKSVASLHDITGYKLAEEALRESEQFNFSLMNNSPNPISVIEPDTTIKYVNPALEELTGFKSNLLIGKKVPYPYWTRESVKRISVGLKMAMKKGAQRVEELFQKKNGEKFWVEITSTPIEENREFKYYLSNWVDITKRKQAEEALLTSEAQLSNAIEIARLGYWEYDVAKDMFTFNDHFYSIFRTSAEQVGGYTMSSARYAQLFVHPEDMQVVSNEIRKAIETTDPNFSRQLEHRMMYADGEPGYIAVRFFIVKDDLGRTVRTYGANQDITERKQVEEALREAKEFQSTLLNYSPNPIIVIEPDTTIKYVNPALEKLTGFKSKELIGKKAPYPFWAEELLKEIGEDLKTGMKEGSKRLEELFQKKNGEKFWVEITSTPIKENGEFKYFLANWIDITKGKQSEEELKKKMNQLERFNRLMVDRELRMVELKKEINELLEKAGSPKKYATN
jgi:PAS domain S-box-containing protein